MCIVNNVIFSIRSGEGDIYDFDSGSDYGLFGEAGANLESPSTSHAAVTSYTTEHSNTLDGSSCSIYDTTTSNECSNIEDTVQEHRLVTRLCFSLSVYLPFPYRYR